MSERARDYFEEAANYFLIVLTYLLCDGLTAILVWPAQAAFVPELTIFAQAVFLPHGVRVLAAWFLGWKSLIPLIVAPLVSSLVFAPVAGHALVAPILMSLVAAGALAAILAFEAMRLAGVNLYFGNAAGLNWRLLLLVGGIAALFDAVSRIWVYGGLLPAQLTGEVLAVVLIGDMLGLLVMMFVLMLIFRWFRRRSQDV